MEPTSIGVGYIIFRLLRTRKDILLDLVDFNLDISTLKSQLSLYPWDSEEELVLLTNNTLLKIIERALEGKISVNQLEEWANLVEWRDDIEMSQSVVDVIFLLANPDINGILSSEHLSSMIVSLRL